MLANSMRSSIGIPNFDLQIIKKTCWKSLPTTFPICLAIQNSFAAILISKNRREINPKLPKIDRSATKPHHVPPNASKKAPEASTSASGWVQQRPMMRAKASKMRPKRTKSVKIIRWCTLVYSL